MLTSLVYLEQANVKKSKKLLKLANIDEENLDVFRMISSISIKLSRKMCLMIILKVTKKQGFTPALEKPQGESQIDTPVFLELNQGL